MRNNWIHKFTAVSFFMVYLFFSVMSIVLRPAIAQPVNAKTQTRIERISKSNSTNNTNNLLQRGSRLTITNKQTFVLPPNPASIIPFLFILSGLAFLTIIKRWSVFFTSPGIGQFHNYLSLRTIRI